MSPTEKKRIIPNHDGVPDCRRPRSERLRPAARMSNVEFDELQDREVRHFLQTNRAKFTRRINLESMGAVEYEIMIKVEHPKLGLKQFHTMFEVPDVGLGAHEIKAFNAQVRIACAVLHWEITCWIESAYS